MKISCLLVYGSGLNPSIWHIQDQGLDMISEGLDTLKNMAHDMNEVIYLLCSSFSSLLIILVVNCDCGVRFVGNR